MRHTLRNWAALAGANRSALVVTLAVSFVVLGSLAQAPDFAQFEQRAMTRLFVLAAFDTLVGARIVAAATRRQEQSPANDAACGTLPRARPLTTRQPPGHRCRHRERTPTRRGDDHDRAPSRR